MVHYSTQMDGDVNGKDWSRRMGDLFKIVLIKEMGQVLVRTSGVVFARSSI